MRIAVFGAGSLGSALGGLLSSSNEVVLIGRRPHVDAMNRRGLTLLGTRRKTIRLTAGTSTAGLDAPDLLIITTKAYDTPQAISACEHWVSGKTKVLTLQNGLGNLELLRAWKGDMAFGGTTTMGAALQSPGKVRISGIGKTVIGCDVDPKGAQAIAGAFKISGVPTTLSGNIEGAIWTKATVNACINPLTAILRVKNGDLLRSPVVNRLMAGVCRECELVARAHHVSIPRGSMILRARAVARGTADNTSSMLLDIERRRRTEIDYLNGAICRMAVAKGLSAPLNCALAGIVKALEHRSRGQKG